MESFLRRSSICSVGVLSLVLAAPRLPAQVPPTPPPQQPQEGEEEAAQEPEAKPKGEPRPPEGILPVGEIARLSFGPSDLPKVLLHGDRLAVVTASGSVEGHDAVT
ncbi:MAG TPA: hypothetical protein VJ921_14305, partial [Vicinamibacteria bacterium]|nr:hypothetical protein [Vicinamibacteria bacterium]